MRVLLLSFEYPPETGFGGIGTYTWYQARALARLGHIVHVLAGATSATPLRAMEHDGVTVFRFRSDGPIIRAVQGSLDRLRLWWTKNRLQNAVSMYQALRALRRQYRYDVIEMPECGAEGMLINTMTRSRTIVRLHSPARLIMPFYDVRRTDVSLCSFTEQRAMNSATAFTSCSGYLAGEARDKLGLRGPIRVIPNGIDVDLFDATGSDDFRTRFGLPADRPIVFFAGRLEPRKGSHLCIEIAATILEKHDVAFVMAGQDIFGFMEREMEPALAARSLRGSFHYLGKLEMDAVRAGVRQSDIFLLPSLWENCPYSCLEAMAAGRAIVSTDQGGMPELIEDGVSGLLARSGDPASYIAAIERLLADDGLRERLGHGARRRVEERFTDRLMATRSVKQYTECLGSAA